jgi:hypothetical protein
MSERTRNRYRSQTSRENIGRAFANSRAAKAARDGFRAASEGGLAPSETGALGGSSQSGRARARSAQDLDLAEHELAYARVILEHEILCWVNDRLRLACSADADVDPRIPRKIEDLCLELVEMPEPPTNPIAYIATCVRNLALDVLRRRARDRELVDDLDLERCPIRLTLGEMHSAVQERMAEDLDRATMVAALRQVWEHEAIPAAYRRLVEALMAGAEVEDLVREEIASRPHDDLGRPRHWSEARNVVHQRRHRAVAWLAERVRARLSRSLLPAA